MTLCNLLSINLFKYMKKSIFQLNRLLIFVLLISGCDVKMPRQLEYYKLSFNDSLDLDVKKTSSFSNVIVINDSLMLNDKCILIYDNYNPKWIFEKTNSKVIYKKDTIFSPIISDVVPPYKFIKNKDSKVFQIIKANDTMTFYLEPIEYQPFYW